MSDLMDDMLDLTVLRSGLANGFRVVLFEVSVILSKDRSAPLRCLVRILGESLLRMLWLCDPLSFTWTVDDKRHRINIPRAQSQCKLETNASSVSTGLNGHSPGFSSSAWAKSTTDAWMNLVPQT